MKKKSLKRNAILNCCKVLLTIIFPLLTYPYATRILGSENIGKVTFGDSIVSYFSLIAMFGISSYAVREGAPLRENKEKFNKFASEMLQINMITSLASVCFLFLLLSLPTKLTNYRTLILIQGLVVLFCPYAVEWLFVIQEDFLYVTVRTFVLQCVCLVCVFLFIRKRTDYYIYAMIMAITTCVVNVLNFLYAKKYVSFSKKLQKGLWKHIKRIAIFFLNSIASSIYLNSDITLLGFFCDDRIVGLYGVSSKIYTIIKSLMNAITSVMIPRFSVLWGKGDEKEYRRLLETLLNVMILLVTPCLIGLFLLRNNIIILMFGQDYEDAANTLGILAFAIGFAVLANIFVNVIMVVQKMERKIIISTISSAVVNIILNFGFIPCLAQDGAAITTVLAEMIVLLIAIYYCRECVYGIRVINTGIQVTVACIFMILIKQTFFWLTGGWNIIVQTVITVVLCAFSYLAVLLILKNKYVLVIIRQYLKHSNENK